MKEKKSKRFITAYEQNGLLFSATVIVDTVTGVNYLMCSSGNIGGLTTLLDGQGRVVVTPVKPEYEGPEIR